MHEPLKLYDKYKTFLAEDFLYRYQNREVAYNLCLIELEKILKKHDKSCSSYGLPMPSAERIDLNYLENVHQFSPLNF